MIYRQFQDLNLSLLGFGTMRLPKNEDGSIDTIPMCDGVEGLE